MTGEITLTGSLLAIGGLNEKLLAAKRNDIKTILIPKDNEIDLKEKKEKGKRERKEKRREKKKKKREEKLFLLWTCICKLTLSLNNAERDILYSDVTHVLGMIRYELICQRP